MDNYMDHLLVLDEMKPNYTKNNWTKHHQDNGAHSMHTSTLGYNKNTEHDFNVRRKLIRGYTDTTGTGINGKDHNKTKDVYYKYRT